MTWNVVEEVEDADHRRQIEALKDPYRLSASGYAPDHRLVVAVQQRSRPLGIRLSLDGSPAKLRAALRGAVRWRDVHQVRAGALKPEANDPDAAPGKKVEARIPVHAPLRVTALRDGAIDGAAKHLNARGGANRRAKTRTRVEEHSTYLTVPVWDPARFGRRPKNRRYEAREFKVRGEVKRTKVSGGLVQDHYRTWVVRENLAVTPRFDPPEGGPAAAQLVGLAAFPAGATIRITPLARGGVVDGDPIETTASASTGSVTMRLPASHPTQAYRLEVLFPAEEGRARAMSLRRTFRLPSPSSPAVKRRGFDLFPVRFAR